MINIEHISISYGKQQVIENLDLQIYPAAIHGLVGLNGSGKTTLINAVCGLKEIEKGNILFHNKPLIRKDIAYLETVNFFYPKITGREYLSLFKLKNKSFDIKGWNHLFDLPLDNFIESYSTGMKKKLAFLGILALNKPILILDEPFNGVDMETTQKIKLIIKQLKDNGKTIIITSHIMESLISLSDTISYLAEKKIKFTCARSEFAGIEEKIFGSFNLENEQLIHNLLI